uniref:hypothetical protein n=1 Tax=Tessaracoccus bendigoensis TaxID=72764 RepID=UPI001114A751|nr:hypothetical protein [Tessaracoccus bendigoensis]
MERVYRRSATVRPEFTPVVRVDWGSRGWLFGGLPRVGRGALCVVGGESVPVEGEGRVVAGVDRRHRTGKIDQWSILVTGRGKIDQWSILVTGRGKIDQWSILDTRPPRIDHSLFVKLVVSQGTISRETGR